MSAVVEVWSDVSCPWAYATLHRLRAARAELGIAVAFKHRSFPLELFNNAPTPKPLHDYEEALLSGIEPEAGWIPWSKPDHEYPVTTLPALEAIHAATAQSLAAGEQMSIALRRALFTQSACISLRHVILDVAASCNDVDAARLEEALDAGTYRATLLADYQAAADGAAKGSPHVFLPDGRNEQAPGFDIGEQDGLPVILRNDPRACVKLLASI